MFPDVFYLSSLEETSFPKVINRNNQDMILEIPTNGLGHQYISSGDGGVKVRGPLVDVEITLFQYA